LAVREEVSFGESARPDMQQFPDLPLGNCLLESKQQRKQQDLELTELSSAQDNQLMFDFKIVLMERKNTLKSE